MWVFKNPLAQVVAERGSAIEALKALLKRSQDDGTNTQAKLDEAANALRECRKELAILKAENNATRRDFVELGRRMMAVDGLQDRVMIWVASRFGAESYNSIPERVDRIVEEAFELAQSEGSSLSRIMRIGAHVFDRPPGHPRQEMAGLATCLLAYAGAKKFKLLDAAADEMLRVERLPIEAFRRKHDEKVKAGISRVFRTTETNPWLKENWNMTEQALLIARNPALARQFQEEASQIKIKDAA